MIAVIERTTFRTIFSIVLDSVVMDKGNCDSFASRCYSSSKHLGSGKSRERGWLITGIVNRCLGYKRLMGRTRGLNATSGA
jgi:hypothetical protein